MLGRLFSQVFRPRRQAPTSPPAPDPQALQLETARSAYRERRFADAEAGVEELLEAAPDNVEALVLKAALLRRSGRTEEAMVWYRRALVIDPRHVVAWLDLGVCHYLRGDPFWARVFYRFANSLDPDNADVWNELGVVELALGNMEQAEQSFDNAVNRNPEHPEAWNNLGLMHGKRGDLANARRHFLRAIFLRPDYYMAQCNLGLVCRDMELFDESDAALRAALAIDPKGHRALTNLGVLQQDRGRLDEALATLESACAAGPSDADAWTALSALRFRRGELAAAQEAAERALACDASDADARLALAHVQLAQRRFDQGWDNYEARALSNASPVRKLPFPPWRGGSVDGRTLLVFGEQGLGDEIMFASCLPDLVAAGARVLLASDARLSRLFRRSFPEVRVLDDLEEVYAPEWRDAIDGCLPIGSLARSFRRSEQAFPTRQAYLRADPSQAGAWRERLAALAGSGPTIGLAWRGGLAKTGRAQRSLGLESLESLLRHAGARWVSLQHDAGLDEIEAFCGPRGLTIAAWPEVLADLDQTAAMTEGLDLVITVCSTMAHLAGALGRPVWVLTPSAPAWRYPAEGEGMPWYPSARLFRQQRPGDWAGVLAQIEQQLQGPGAAQPPRRAVR